MSGLESLPSSTVQPHSFFKVMIWAVIAVTAVVGVSASSERERANYFKIAIDPCSSTEKYSRLFNAIPLTNVVLLLQSSSLTANGPDRDGGAEDDSITELLVMLTTHNKIMQIFTKETNEWRNFYDTQTPRQPPPSPLWGYGQEISQKQDRNRSTTYGRESSLFIMNGMGRMSKPADEYLPSEMESPISSALRNGRTAQPRDPLKRQSSANELSLPKLSVRPDTMIIIVIEHISLLNDFYTILAKHPNVIKFILFHTAGLADDFKSLETVLLAFVETLWNLYKIYYIFFVPLAGVDPNDGLAFFYNPFSGRRTADDSLGRLETLSIGLTDNTSDLVSYIETIAGNRNRIKYEGYPLRCALFPSTMTFLKTESPILNKTAAYNNSNNKLDLFFGLDLELTKELALRLNFTPTVTGPSDDMAYGFMAPDGTFNGALGDVIYYRAEFTANGFFIKDYLTRDLEFSTPSYNDKLCIIVRSADRIPDSLLIFKCFTVQVWIAAFLTIIAVSNFYGYFSAIAKSIEGDDRRSPDNVGQMAGHCPRSPEFLKECARIIAVLWSAPIQHVQSSTFERLFMAICMLWSLNFLGAFQGSLVDVYTIPKTYANIDTLEALDESNIRIAVEHEGLIVDVFGDEMPGSTIGNLRQKLYPANSSNLFSTVASERTVATLERLKSMPKLDQQYVRPDGLSYLHAVQDCPRSYNLAYVLPTHSIFTEAFNHYIGLFSQSGLISHWTAQTEFLFTLEGDLIKREHVRDTIVILTLSHLQTAFYALFGGVIISCLVFGIELWAARPR